MFQASQLGADSRCRRHRTTLSAAVSDKVPMPFHSVNNVYVFDQQSVLISHVAAMISAARRCVPASDLAHVSKAARQGAVEFQPLWVWAEWNHTLLDDAGFTCSGLAPPPPTDRDCGRFSLESVHID